VRIPRWTLFWILVIAVLVIVEIAEITRLFTLPLGIAALSPLTIIVSLVLITILALVGAVFVGFYLSSQIYSARGFTPFEQEMLKMRQEVSDLHRELKELHGAPPTGTTVPPPKEERP
jgi:membrane protein implicated in regulation of membrane protease activity